MIYGPQPAGRRLVSPTLVGRTAELATLVSAATDPPAVATIEGEAGIGKTRLVSELRSRPELAGVRWAAGACPGIREPFPLAPVVEAVRGLGAALAGRELSPVAGALRPLLPELQRWLPPLPPPADRAGQRHRVFRGLVELLAAVTPAVLVLEDLHWADPQTVEFTGYLLADPPPGLCTVLTFRGDEVPAQVRALTARLPAAVGCADLLLQPLDPAETGQLAAEILGTPGVPAEFAASLCQRAAGLPFAVEELLALLRARGEPVGGQPPAGQPPGGELTRGGLTGGGLTGLAVPTGVRDLTMHRVDQLSGDAREVVTAAAVLRMPVPMAVLAAVTGLPEPRLLPAVGEALTRGLLAEHGEAVGFRHPLAGEAVAGAIPSPRQRDLHERAAAGLRTLDPTPLGQIAFHLRRAGRDGAWVAAAEQAAEQAIALGDDAEAVRLLADVLRYASLPGGHRTRLAAALARAAIQTVHITGEVTDLLGDVLARDAPAATPAARGELAFRLALLREAVGAPAREVRQLYTEAVDQLDRPDLRAWALTGLAIPTAPGVRLAEHRHWLRRALAALPAVEDPQFQVFLLGKAAMVRAVTGDRRWRELTDLVRERTPAGPRHRREVNAYQSAGMALAYAGHHRQAEQLLAAAATGAGDSRELRLRVESARVLLDYSRGSWDGLDQTVAELLAQLADYPVGRIDVELVAGCLALARGDLAGAEPRLVELVSKGEATGGYEVMAYAVDGLARLALGRGDPGSGADPVGRLASAVARKGWWAPVARALPAATKVLLAAGQPEAAQALVGDSARRLARLDVPLAPAALRHAGALLAEASHGPAPADRRDPAADLLDAAARYQRLGCPYQAAQAREQAALVRLRAGAAGSVELAAALDGYRRLGARWDADRVAHTARQHGLSAPARYRRGRRGYGDQLSPREYEVAALAAAGQTNKQIARELFLSPKTVEKHVCAAMRKLGVHSRVALGHRLADDPAAPQLMG